MFRRQILGIPRSQFPTQWLSHSLTTRQLSTLFPSPKWSTSDRIKSYCKQQDLTVNTVPLHPSNDFPPAKLHSITVSAARPAGTLLYLHGGGYTHPISRGHLELSSRLAQALNCRDLQILEYTLLPQGKYPTQLAQAAEALRHLLQSYAPRNIAVAGDSAGGNLVLSLLAHLKMPHSRVAEVGLGGKLGAAVCISPRCENGTGAGSFERNAGRDIIDAESVEAFVRAWEPAEDEVWAAANNGGEEFWEGQDALKVDKLLVVAGEDECYLDDIRVFSSLVSAAELDDERPNNGRQLLVLESTIHAQAVIEMATGNSEGRMTQALLEWAVENPIDDNG